MMKRIAVMLLAICLFTAQALADDAVIPKVRGLRKMSIPDTEAMRFVKGMKIGWNLGNTFDATNDWYRGSDLDIERSWCGVMTTREMIEAVHAAGYQTLRLPVSWHNHVDGDLNINPAWLDRVQEVADWALDCGMHVIINIHHDVYPEYLYPSSAHFDSSKRYITAIWSQISARFRDYGDHLIFEAMNEPRPKDTPQEWWFNRDDPVCTDTADCINRLNQAFVDTVRGSGGKNIGRYLMVPGYAASPGAALDTEYFKLPSDSVPNRIILSVHAYTPYDFALNISGTTVFSPADTAQYSELINLFSSLYDTYVSQGIPVVIGEFGALSKNNLQDRVTYYAYYVSIASSRGIPVIVWDNHAFSGNGELFGLLDRKNVSWPQKILVDAMMSGVSE